MLSRSRCSTHASAARQASVRVLQPAAVTTKAAPARFLQFRPHFFQRAACMPGRLEVFRENGVQLALPLGLLVPLQKGLDRGSELGDGHRPGRVEELVPEACRECGPTRRRTPAASRRGPRRLERSCRDAAGPNVSATHVGLLCRTRLLISAKVAWGRASMIRMICRAYSIGVVSGRRAFA